MASQTSATALPQKTKSGSQSKTKTNTQAPHGEGFDLRGRQHRIAREQNDRRESEEVRKRNEELLGRRLEALSAKYKQRNADQQEGEGGEKRKGGGRGRKGGRGVAVPLFGGGGGVQVDTEGVQFRSNEEALPMRQYPKAPRKQQTQRRRPVGAEYDATAAAFGPALCGSGPAPAPKLPVIWGPGMAPPPPPKPEPEPEPEREPTPPAPAVTGQWAAIAAKPPAPPRPQTPEHPPPPSHTTPLAAPTNDVWGAETDEEDDDEDIGAPLEEGQAWGSV